MFYSSIGFFQLVLLLLCCGYVRNKHTLLQEHRHAQEGELRQHRDSTRIIMDKMISVEVINYFNL